MSNHKQDLFKQLNAALISQGKNPLKSWKQSIAKLEERVAKERRLAAELASRVAMQEAGDLPGDDAEQTPAEAHKAEAKKGPAPKGKLTIAKVSRAGIEAGDDNDTIHARLMAHAENDGLRYNETKKWYITWYRSSIKRKAAKAADDAEEKE